MNYSEYLELLIYCNIDILIKKHNDLKFTFEYISLNGGNRRIEVMRHRYLLYKTLEIKLMDVEQIGALENNIEKIRKSFNLPSNTKLNNLFTDSAATKINRFIKNFWTELMLNEVKNNWANFVVAFGEIQLSDIYNKLPIWDEKNVIFKVLLNNKNCSILRLLYTLICASRKGKKHDTRSIATIAQKIVHDNKKEAIGEFRDYIQKSMAVKLSNEDNDICLDNYIDDEADDIKEDITYCDIMSKVLNDLFMFFLGILANKIAVHMVIYKKISIDYKLLGAMTINILNGTANLSEKHSIYSDIEIIAEISNIMNMSAKARRRQHKKPDIAPVRETISVAERDALSAVIDDTFEDEDGNEAHNAYVDDEDSEYDTE